MVFLNYKMVKKVYPKLDSNFSASRN